MNRNSWHVLYLEDNPDDAELVERTLQKAGYTISLVRVENREGFLLALRNDIFDVILSDHSLPQFSSTEALRICKRAQVIVPIILVTGTVSEEFAANCIKMGADDYILKSNLSRLPQAIANAIQQRNLQAEKLKTELSLRLKNEELTKINQELDSFVYSVSHNLRAPLMSVLGLLNLANKDSHKRDAVYDHYFKMMEDSVRKLDETLKEILEYSRNARVELAFNVVDFEGIINDSIQRLQYMEGFDRIRFDIDVLGKGNKFLSDTYRLSVLVSNLLSNAIKYRDPSKDMSHILIHVDISNSHGATLRFEDNGIGIHTDQLNNIFRMFYRATDRSDGAGLGLYIVQEVVEKLNGSIDVSSSLGKGTIFSVTIPNKIATKNTSNKV